MNVLILEDVEVFIDALTSLCQKKSLDYTVASNVHQAKEAVLMPYDIILLDYYAPDGIYHQIDVFSSPEKIISISSVSHCNELARRQGVSRVVEKSIHDIDGFVNLVSWHIDELLEKQT